MEREIIIKKFNLATIIICIPAILLIAFKLGAPLVSAETMDKSKKITTKSEVYPMNVNPAPPKITNISGSNYTVKPGDSLFLIAQKYGISVQSLKNANGLTSSLIYPGQILKIPTGQTPAPAPKNNNQSAPYPKTGNPWLIKVSKYNHTLAVYYQGQLWRSYHVELGDSGLADKQVSGDHKTPEGAFYITEKSVMNPPDEYLGSRWMRLSYPNIEDAQRGLRDGIIDYATYNEIVTAINAGQTPPQRTALGGGVGIHGGDKPEFQDDWTWGCVGLTDKDIEGFFDKIPVGTQVIIQK